MKTKTKNIAKKQNISSEKKLEQAKADFNKIMIQIKPFITKSDIILTSTEGKWRNTSSFFENEIPQNFSYRF